MAAPQQQQYPVDGQYQQQQQYGGQAPVQTQPAPRTEMSSMVIPEPSVGPQRGQWSTGLFACSPGAFCMSCCCSCIVFGKTRQRLDALAQGRVLKAEEADPFSIHTLVFLGLHCFTGLGALLDFFNRGAIRHRYAIAGNEGEDFLLTCCCLPCSQTQQIREIELEENGGQSGHLATGPSHMSDNTMAAHQEQKY